MFKRKYNTIELCIGISPKADKKAVVKSNAFLMWGVNYDLSYKIKNQIYLSIPLTFLVGGDYFKEEKRVNGIILPNELETRYSLANFGLGLKYIICLSKKENKNFLMLNTGVLFSYKYTYSSFISNSYSSPTGEVTTTSLKEYYSFKDGINNIVDHNKWAVPLFLKIGFKKRCFSLSITQFIFTHESYYYSDDHLKRYFTNINLGIDI